MIDVKFLLRDLWHSGNLQEWLNHRFKKEGYIPVPIGNFRSIETINGIHFPINDQFHCILEVFEDYKFDDIRPNDIVIDIGANIGGFTLQAAEKTERIFAIEPIFIDQLRSNIEINNKQVYIIEGALGQSGGFQEFVFGEHKKRAKTYDFTELKKIAGGCDFLKCDCEGGEWYIKPEELEGIRRIEMELHRLGPNHKRGFKVLMEYLYQNYKVSFKDLSTDPNLYGIVHAVKILDKEL
jgi:hypothetical protein